MTESIVEKSDSNDVAPAKANPVAEPKQAEHDAGDAKSSQQSNKTESGPEGKGDADSKSRDEQAKEEQKQKPYYYQRRGRFHGRFRMNRRFRYRSVTDEKQERNEEQPQEKPVVAKGVTGKVKWYSFRKNYGFIQRDDGEKDVFVHQMAIAKSRIRKPHLRTLGHDEAVEFDVVQGKRGLEAFNVTGPNGAEVQGCRIIFVYDDSFGRRPRLPYYNDRPPYYSNYARRPYYRQGYEEGRYQGPRRPYQGSRDRPSYRDNLDRQTYPRKVYRGYRRSSRAIDEHKEEDVKVKEAAADDKKGDDVKVKKGYGRRRQYRRRYNQKKDQDTASKADSSAKEASSTKTASGEEKANASEVKNAGVIEVSS